MLFFGLAFLICVSLGLFVVDGRKNLRILFSGVIAGGLFLVLFGSGMVITQEKMGQTITLTATGQQNKDGKNNEIWLKEVVVGKQHKSADVISGKWIIDGKLLGWRNYRTVYQMTDSIVIRLPLGKEFSMVFLGNQWSGSAVVSWNGRYQVLDTFVNTDGRKEIVLPLKLGLEESYNQSQKVLLLLLVISLIVAIASGECLSRLYFRNKEWIEGKLDLFLAYVKKYYVSFACLLISLASFALMLKYAGGRSLWDDDLAQLDLSGKWMTFSQMLEKWLHKEVTNPPFISIVGAIWLRIVPYGTFWIKLLCILFISWGVYLCGMVGRRIGGGRLAILASLISGTSSFVIITGAYTFRNYGPLFPFTALFILYYIRRFDHVGNEKWSDCIKYGLIMTLLSYTHYFGILTIGAFFLADVALFLRKKISWKCVLSYVLTGVLFLPWFIVALNGSAVKYETFWPSVPTPKTIFDLSMDLCSGIKLVWFSAILGYFVVVVDSLRDFLKKRNLSKPSYYKTLLVFSTIFVVMVVYIYSANINPSRSVFVTRYFISILPMVYLLIAIGIDSVLSALVVGRLKQERRLIELIAVFLVVFLSEKAFFTVKQHAETTYEDYEQAGDWIYDQSDAHRNDTVIVASTAYLEGWKYYYISHDGQRPELTNIISPDQLDGNALESINIVYIHTAHKPVSKETLTWLEQSFEEIDENQSGSVKKYKRK
jgi:hypothetical protein